MSDFLSRLAARQMPTIGPDVRPIVAPRFAPAPDVEPSAAPWGEPAEREMTEEDEAVPAAQAPRIAAAAVRTDAADADAVPRVATDSRRVRARGPGAGDATPRNGGGAARTTTGPGPGREPDLDTRPVAESRATTPMPARSTGPDRRDRSEPVRGLPGRAERRVSDRGEPPDPIPHVLGLAAAGGPDARPVVIGHETPEAVTPAVEDDAATWTALSALLPRRRAARAPDRDGDRTAGPPSPRRPEPVVHITIGAVEVTAVTAPPPARRQPRPRPPAPSLDEFLARGRRTPR